jgi:hypothetical protein
MREVIFASPPWITAYCSSAPSCVAMSATPLARSIGEPPPSAMTPSHADSRKRAAAAITASSSGFCGVPSKTTASGRIESTRAITSPDASPGSVTSMGRRIASDATMSASRALAPKSNSMVVR